VSVPLAADLETPVRAGLTSVATFIPRLLGFLVVLVVGYVIAKAIAKVVDKLLEKAGFDRAVERGGISKALASSPYDASDIVAKLVFLAIFIPVLSMALGVLGIVALQQPMAAFIALIPKILVAVVLVVLGALLAGMVKSFVANALGALSYGSTVATAVGALILFGFVKAALDQVGIATVVTTALLYTVFAAVAGVVIVGVGGGLIQPMQSRWESMLNKADSEKDRVQAHVRAQAAADPGQTAYPVDTGQTTRLSPPLPRR
jgi:hypothetical protein